MLPRFAARAWLALPVLLAAPSVGAEEASGTAAGPNEQQLQAWLATKPASADVSKAPEAPEAPPPPPRRHGFVIESSLGALGHVGALRQVTPIPPWFHVGFGWELTHWFMLLVQGDVAFSTTSLANPPPAPRNYALFGLSGAARFGVQPSRAVGLFVQGEIGATETTEDVLSTYGFKDANQLGPYFGGLLGVEWYQINPHMALALQGGARSYAQVLDRSIGSGPPLAWIGAAGLKYTF